MGSTFILALGALSLCCLWKPPLVQAQSVLRVSRGGVIYYHFSDRPGAAAGAGRQLPSAGAPPRLRPPAKKLSPAELQPVIQEAGTRHQLPPALIKALIRVESNFNPAATSPKGAQGLMQLMPETASDLQVRNPYDIQENIWGGSRYVSQLLKRFNYRLPLALAAYNAGPQRVDRTLEVPRIPETETFVRAVLTEFLKYRAEERLSPPARP